jgi:hypothetical protein
MNSLIMTDGSINFSNNLQNQPVKKVIQEMRILESNNVSL